jgi:hypothetical protein
MYTSENALESDYGAFNMVFGIALTLFLGSFVIGTAKGTISSSVLGKPAI